MMSRLHITIHTKVEPGQDVQTTLQDQYQWSPITYLLYMQTPNSDHLYTGTWSLRPQVRSRLYGLTNNGSCGLFFGSLRKTGRCNIADLLPISLTGTAGSNSNARTSVKRSAFILCSTWSSSVELNAGSTHTRQWDESYSLDEGEAVCDACSGAAEEGE